MTVLRILPVSAVVRADNTGDFGGFVDVSRAEVDVCREIPPATCSNL